MSQPNKIAAADGREVASWSPATGAAALVVPAAFREPAWDGERRGVLVYLFLATASHGLDMLTNSGHGVALFAPFENSRTSALPAA